MDFKNQVKRGVLETRRSGGVVSNCLRQHWHYIFGHMQKLIVGLSKFVSKHHNAETSVEGIKSLKLALYF